MTRWMTSAKLFVLGAFLLASLAATAYEVFYVWPEHKCDAQGLWWDPKDRQCLSPMPIWRLTGRTLVAPPQNAVSGLTPTASDPHRVAAGAQSTSPAPPSLANRAATNSRSDSRLR